MVDMDKLLPGQKRPDFLGLDTHDNFHVFESKGRSSSLGKEELDKWKKQAESVRRLKASNKLKEQIQFVPQGGVAEITFNIVSAAYINRAHEWELLWMDPSSDPEGDLLTFDEFSFFEAYYGEIIAFLDQSNVRIDSAYGELAYIPEIELYLGLHKEIREGYEQRDTEAIKTFAVRRMESETPEESDVYEPRLYADGFNYSRS